MEALRFISNVKNKQILLDIPANFTAEEVEIIVLPHQTHAKKLNELLLSGPVWSDDDIKEIEKVSEGFKSWKIEEF